MWIPAFLTRLSHHLLHRMPYSLEAAPSGARLLIGASPEAALRGCGGVLLQEPGASIDAGGTEPDSALLKGFGLSQVGSAKDLALPDDSGVVFAPSFTSCDPEDIACLDRLAAALKANSNWSGEVWLYETSTPLWPNRGVDISSVFAQKSEQLAAVCDTNALAASSGLAHYRGLRPIRPQAEAFLALKPSEFLREFPRWRERMA